MFLQPVTLNGQIVRLEPLSLSHAPDLALAGQDPAIWQYMLYGQVCGLEKMQAWIGDILQRQATLGDLPFAILHQASGRAVGATRFMEVRPAHRGLEIGGSWVAPEYQRTGVNTEAKFLLLRYAFETLACIRVQFKTDARNFTSQRAIERLGAQREGVLRNHIITPEGVVRDSVYYSILAQEWPQVKAALLARLR